jgi:hypothetical protein
MTHPDLTPAQAAALQAFAKQHGDNWREPLVLGWMQAAYPGALQQIRNQFGPTWLYDVYAYGWQASLPAWGRHDAADGEKPAEIAAWSGAEGFDPPAIGDRVIARDKAWGEGTVTGYFLEEGWLGLIVRYDAPPERWLKKNGDQSCPVHQFGAEVRPVRPPVVDNSAEAFGAKVSIADLAINSVQGRLTGEGAIAQLKQDWQWELAADPVVTPGQVAARFKDGSALTVFTS